MHIFITGGSGRNGTLAIRAALDRGHSVTALVRNPSTLSPSHPNLTVVDGAPTAPAAVRRGLLAGPALPDAVITTLSLRRTSDSPFAPLAADTAPDFLSKSMQTLLDSITSVYAETTAALPKVVVNSSVGVGDSWAAMSWPFKLIFSVTPMRFGLRDHGAAQRLLEESGLPFVLARPVRLVEGESAPVEEYSADGRGLSWNPSATRASVADWMVTAAEENTWDGIGPVLAN